MIFIDVTQSCRSSNNSGIQVVTRNLYREINAQKEVTPLIWDNFLKNYSHLNKRELKNLTDPFDKDYQAKERPNKQENPFYKEFLKSFFRLKRIKNLIINLRLNNYSYFLKFLEIIEFLNSLKLK
jgi:hypothetical protein